MEHTGNDEVTVSYEEQLLHVNEIAKPMSSEKYLNKIYKLIRKASAKKKTHLIIGLKAVQNKIRKGEKGLVIIAGDVRPIDTISHIPCVCEENDIPYIYTPSKKRLGASLGSNGSCILILIKKDTEYEAHYDKVFEIIKKTHNKTII